MKKLLFIALSLLSVGSVMCGLFQLEEASVADDPGRGFEVAEAADIDAPQSTGLVGSTVRAADDVVTGVAIGATNTAEDIAGGALRAFGL